jgi:hypothetical protein
MKNILAIICLTSFMLCDGRCSAQAQAPHRLGLTFTEHGVKRPDVSMLFKVAPLPPADYSLEKFFYFDNQQTLGACGAFSASESFDALSQFNGAACRLSCMDIYQRTTDWPNDAGVSNAALLKTMQAGNVLEATFPYDPARFGKKLKVTAKVTAERKKHVTLNGYSLDGKDLLNAIKRCIHQLHIAPIIGTLWYPNQFDAPETVVSTKDANGKIVKIARCILPNPKGSPAGGHDVPAVAYDDSMVFPNGDVGGIEFHNHWANDQAGKIPWGDARGCAWASYRFLANPRYADDVVAFDRIK